MQTVGQLIKKARGEKKLNLDDVAKATKIRVRYLEALENDEYSLLPSAIAAKGFIKNYGRLLGLPVETLLALFRRDFIETETGQVVPRGMVKPLNRPTALSWTPTRTMVLLVGLATVLLGGYFARQLLLLGGSPSLTLDQPLADQVLEGRTVTVRGKVDPDSTVEVNQQLASVEKDGTFQAVIELPPGKNTIMATAVSKSKKETKVARIVYVK